MNPEPAPDLEFALREAIAAVRGVDHEEIRREATIDDLALDSLDVAEMVVSMEQRLGRELPLETLMSLDRAETLASTAARLRAQLAVPPAR